MVSPKPITLTQVDAGDYESAFEPQPFVVVGPIPGGGGGGGAVDSVNGQTGVVEIDLDSLVTDATVIEGNAKTIAMVDSLASPTSIVSVDPFAVRARGLLSDKSASVTPEGVTVGHGANSTRLEAPASGGAVAVTLPAAAGTLALTSQIPDVSGLAPYTALNAVGETALAAQTRADDAYDLADAAVPNTRTVAGKALSANVTLVKGDVGLGNVDNTSDASKPVSTAQQTALNLKANTADVVPNTRTVAGKALSANVTLVKGDVGLGNVDNTADSAKPVSTAQAAAINAKVGSPNSTVTGVAWYATVGDLPATGTTGVLYFVDAE